MGKNQSGRPPKYTSVEEIEEKIERYFESCKGVPLLDADSNPMVDKWGNPIMAGQKPPTITGLALALGFASRQALLNYQAKKEFNDTITRAKSRVEEYAEAACSTGRAQTAHNSAYGTISKVGMWTMSRS